MRRGKGRMLLATVAALALVVGVGTAIAATGGSDLKQEASRYAARTTFETSVAKSLGTTAAKLKAAIKGAALARVNEARAADEITAAEAETLQDALADGDIPAMRLATAAGVAKQLDTTVAKLNAAYGDAQKAHAKARVDAALKAGNITEKFAAELKVRIDQATFPGFGMGHHGGPGGPGGGHPGGSGGPGMGGFGGPALGMAPPSTPAALAPA